MPSLFKSTPFTVIMGASFVDHMFSNTDMSLPYFSQSPTKPAHEIQHLKASSFATAVARKAHKNTGAVGAKLGCVSALLSMAQCCGTACFTRVADCTGVGAAMLIAVAREMYSTTVSCATYTVRWLGDAYSWRGTHVLHQRSWCGID